MSVHIIYYEDGAKKMRPITSESEYRALRSSEKQFAILKRVRNKGDAVAKARLIQMNYSCLPNPDNSLKGATRVSSTVGMDVDFVPPKDCENPEDWLQKQLAGVPEMVLKKKEELGLLMLERSATKGYHLVFKRNPELSQEDNLKRASELLGVKYDEGAKDITRVFFTTTDEPDDLLYLDAEIFEILEADAGHADGAGTGGQVHVPFSPESSETEKGTRTSPPVPSTHSLKAFDLCVKEVGLDPEKMDVWGEHNWHSNLMAVLSAGLPKLVSKEQLLAVVQEKLSNYSQTADCRNLIDYFYEKYAADKGFMSSNLRSINAQAQKLEGTSESDEEEIEESLTRNWNPPALPKKIPRILDLLVRNYDPRFRDMLLLSSLPVLSAHASHFRAQYLDGKIIGPQQYVAIIGGSGSGKSYATNLYSEMIEYTLQDNDNREWEKVRQNAELRDQKANAKEKPAKYHPKLRLFETTSKSSILELMTNVGENGMLLGQFSEVDGLSGMTKTSYSDISVILRKAWDGDMHRQFYMTDASCNTYTRMCISLLMAGTVKSMLERMFNDNNCEGGLMQRCIPVLIPKTQRTFRPPRLNYLNPDEKKERDALLMDLYQKDLSLGNTTLELECTQTLKAIGEWFDSLEIQYNDGEMTEAEADLSHRCGQFILRAAIPLIALYGQETKEIVEFSVWVGKMAHYGLCQLFGHRVQQDLMKADQILTVHLDGRKTAEPLLDKLPEVFTIDQFKSERIRSGQSGEVFHILGRYTKNGRLKRVKRGVYEKVKRN